MKVCFKVPVTPDNPEGVSCVEIPVYVDERFKFGPPEPPEYVDFRDLSILASIETLARGLSGDLGAGIIESVGARVAATTRRLGPGVMLRPDVAGVTA